MDPRLRRLSWTLRIGLGVIFVISGSDKYLNLMTYWPQYVSDTFAHLMPVSAQTFMYLVGAIEVLIGLAMLGLEPMLGGYAASLWMLAVALDLITAGLYDLASRDVAIALGTFAVAQLSRPLHTLTEAT